MKIDGLFNVEGKIALVTGGSRGIGAMIAEGLISAGVTTYICARQETELLQAVEKLSAFGDCRGIVADLSASEQVGNLARRIGEEQSSLHILVNNAGATWSGEIEEIPRAAFEKVLSTNLSGPFELIQCLLPLLRNAATRDDPARIINISSTSGMVPPQRPSFPYSSSKAGIIMLTKHLAAFLASEAITVNSIAPGVFASRMTEFMFDENHRNHVPLPTFPMGRPGNPEDIAAAVLYLAARSGSYITGINLPVSGGFGRLI